MAEVVDIIEFKKRKLKRLEDEWAMYMDRASVFMEKGQRKFADEMIAKAKVLRKEIDKLRVPVPRKPYLKQANAMTLASMDYTFSGLAGADLGYPKPLTPPE